LLVEFLEESPNYLKMIRTISFLLATACFSLSAKTLEDVVDQARGFIGPDDKIEAITSLVYEGTLTPADGQESRGIRLVLQKPAKQLLEITQGDGQINMLVNNFEGFMIQKNLTTDQVGISPLPTDQVRRFKANAAENLYFFEFPAKLQVRAKYLGEDQFRGKTVDTVRYVHSGGIQFLRYFDPETGELVGTLTDTGSLNTEEGLFEVDGLRFSKKVLSYENGELVHTIEFSKITINPELDAEAFSLSN